MLNWLYPPACMGCAALIPLNDKRRVAVRLCEGCEALLVCPEEVPERDTYGHIQVDAIYSYEGILRDIIRDIKFRRKKNHARALGILWGDPGDVPRARRPLPPLRREAVLVPVPLHPKKERQRGFNQAAVMARGLARGMGLPVENTLRRTVDTAPQAGLHPARRIENVAGAFCLAPGAAAADKSFILIDDIYTTGASLNECARVLLAHGAARVTAMTLSVTLRRD